MHVGDLAVLYTDGIDEAMDADDQLFGIERVRQLTAEGGDAEAVKDRIVAEVRNHIGDAPPFDDMCLVVMERLEKANAQTVAAEQTGAAEEVAAG
jgi:serine phosphatase RsbU (regulator of sigma subunit)